jgi:hypothetical protein
MDKKIQKSWEYFLNPDVVRPSLINASIYIAAFEMLEDTIIGRIRDFFCNGFNQKGDIIDPEYQTKVLSLNKSPMYASLEWLKGMKAIKQSDMDTFEKIKKCRNNVAHELHEIIVGRGLPEDFNDNFRSMILLLHKIEVWWIVNVEVPTNPDYDGQEIDEDGIMTGALMSIRILCDVALGTDEQSRFYYEQFKKLNK